MPVSLFEKTCAGKLPANLSAGKSMETREAFRVYLCAFAAYKMFKSKNQADTAWGEMNAAKLADVPVSRSVKPIYEAILDENGERNTVYVLESERSSGEFFQLSKPGHIVRIVSAVRGVKFRKNSALRAFGAAQAFGLTDAQGFFDFTQGMPIRFIDIHHAANPAPQIQDVIDGLQAL